MKARVGIAPRDAASMVMTWVHAIAAMIVKTIKAKSFKNLA
jgi:hypothetical protein